MTKFSKLHGRYNSPYESRYAQYIKARAIDQKDQAALKNDKKIIPKIHGSYGALLFHPKWKQKRSEILRRDNHQCVICKGDHDLEVHHRQYHFIIATKEFKPPWEYSNNLLISLCSKCHQRGHAKYKVPIINI